MGGVVKEKWVKEVERVEGVGGEVWGEVVGGGERVVYVGIVEKFVVECV